MPPCPLQPLPAEPRIPTYPVHLPLLPLALTENKASTREGPPDRFSRQARCTSLINRQDSAWTILRRTMISRKDHIPRSWTLRDIPSAQHRPTSNRSVTNATGDLQTSGSATQPRSPAHRLLASRNTWHQHFRPWHGQPQADENHLHCRPIPHFSNIIIAENPFRHHIPTTACMAAVRSVTNWIDSANCRLRRWHRCP